MSLPIVPETHQRGHVSVENAEMVALILEDLSGAVDFGIQTHDDGRVWICINGIAWIRFKPILTRKS